MKIYFLFAFFILLNAFFIISNNNLSLDSIDNAKTFFNLYLGWFQQIGDNLTEITGNVVNQEWVFTKTNTS
tara:strand:- start:213 stop:425 length:213 start_codon:yes stop_codon:yes gene_type:complete